MVSRERTNSKKLATGLCIFILLMLSACKKDHQDPSDNQNPGEKEKLIISHGWHLAKMIVDGKEVKSNPWDIDDCWIFRSDKTYIYSQGSLTDPLYSGNHSDRTGNWNLSEDENFLNYGAIVPVKIEKITSDSLILSMTSLEGYLFISTYVRCSQ